MNATAETTNIVESPEKASIRVGNAKHQKTQRYFPFIDEIAVGDRFTIPNGNGCWSNTLEATIMLAESAKVEVVGVNGSQDNIGTNFDVVKLTLNTGGEWVRDQKLGTLTVEYTALAGWHHKK